ncbi:MAG: thioredoxin-disulfide reductase [Anaerolineales bacterium]|nr:thioredoxin-disulfide reductase [Anaerolineales bacterium]
MSEKTQPVHRRVIILGSGPAGLTAAIYSARAYLEPLLISGDEPGGQLTLTTDVENYPGYPEGIQGPDMMEDFRAQAERFNTEFQSGHVQSVDLSGTPFRLQLESRSDTISCDSLIVATGASAKWLGLESESALRGRGVSACATCDGFFFRDKEVAVVGGGDTAMEEALFLTKFASKVYVIHRREELRASQFMQQRAFSNEKIGFVWDSAVVDVLSADGEAVDGLQLRNVKTETQRELRVDGVFVAIGHKPNTDLFRGQLELDELGYIDVKPGSTYTSVEGVFACGDAADKEYRQAVTAAGTGCMAAIDAERWLTEQES